MLREALDDVARLETTVAELLTIARASRVTSGSISSLPEVLGEINATWRGPLAAVGRPLAISVASDSPPLRGSNTMLRHALDVLIDNALNHGAGEVRVDNDVAPDSVTITVSDGGQGFVDAAFSASSSQAGITSGDLHGLGLPLARRLVEAVPGRLTISHAGNHPRVEIVLQRQGPLSSA